MIPLYQNVRINQEKNKIDVIIDVDIIEDYQRKMSVKIIGK
jgi:hypothetical protein